MDEREIITYLRDRFTKPPHLQNWLDDDCEIINLGKMALLVSVDTSSEKADFPSETPPEENRIAIYSIPGSKESNRKSFQQTRITTTLDW